MLPTWLAVTAIPASFAAWVTPATSFAVKRVERGINRLTAAAEGFEHGESGGHGQRISAERSGLIDGAERRDLVHQSRRAAVGADRAVRRR